ncbi:XAC2610-related protein [Taibaiella chishuiensis]|uniref:VCBS repeat protein n=1 Tax=Taibaiella chishuiensis TaxID=1434707 RepID=A0A2P8D342_9BACT|nr:hypothetical protein [Taibaiella chishuiensis]PSK91641.1 hypothetical protein B0I18_105226 [Taibaiella chishuiensis]
MQPFTVLLVLLGLALRATAQEIATVPCDAVYPGKGYLVRLQVFNNQETDETRANMVFSFCQQEKGQERALFRDSVFSSNPSVDFEDFNNDGIKDILLQHYSDVRSNQGSYLYLVDTVTGRLKKIKGFEQIKNPLYIAADNLVSNTVMSGTNWSGFYQVQGDHVRDFGITIDGDDDKAREQALRKIRKRKDWVAPAAGQRQR